MHEEGKSMFSVSLQAAASHDPSPLLQQTLHGGCKSKVDGMVTRTSTPTPKKYKFATVTIIFNYV